MFSFLLLGINQDIQPPFLISCIWYPPFENLPGILNSLFSDSTRSNLEFGISRRVEYLSPKGGILALLLHHKKKIPHQCP